MTETKPTKWDKRSRSYRRTKDDTGNAARLLCEVFRGVTRGQWQGALACKTLAEEFAAYALRTYLDAVCEGAAPLTDETRRALHRDLNRELFGEPNGLLHTPVPLLNGETIGEALEVIAHDLVRKL